MGEYLSKPNQEKKSEEGESGKLRYGLSGMQGWRRSMEDSHICSLDIGDGISIFGVFDGHGGKEVALFVQRHFIKELKKLESFKKKDYKTALQEIFLKMDQLMLTKEGKKEIMKLARDDKDADGMQAEGGFDQSYAGCTANVVMITKTEIICANAGDSRAVLSKKGKAKDLSVDHKPDTPSEKRRIERANGYVEESRVNGMLALSRSMGDFEYKGNSILKPEDQIITAFPDITVEKIMNDTDFIICACDGIWDCMSSQEAVTYVNEQLKSKKGKESLGRVVEDMLDHILATDVASSGGIGCDNMTCIIIEFKK